MNSIPSSTSTLSHKAWFSWSLVFEGTVLVGAAILLLFGHHAESIKTLALVFVSIVLEALPFILYGTLISGIIEVFVSKERVLSIIPSRGWKIVPIAAAMGLIFPVCECAVVPVVRRLTKKGIPFSAAVAYLLGGPIVNPIVFLSTLLAYELDYSVAILRIVIGYTIAVIVGWIAGWIFDTHTGLLEHTNDKSDCTCGHSHLPNQCAPDHTTTTFGVKSLRALRHAVDDFMLVAHYLIIGAFIAALANTFIERDIYASLTTVPLLPILVMMGLAATLNLCSEADAFIAASFRNIMPISAQMAFMLLGPMFDLKLLLMYQTLFRKTAIIAVVVLVLGAVLGAAVGIEIAQGGS